MYVFDTPFCAFLLGGTRSGKSVVANKLIKHQKEMTTCQGFEQIFYFYGSWQPLYQEKVADNVQYIEGLPPEDFFEKVSPTHEHTLLVFDDLMNKLSKQEYLSTLFMEWCHHRNLSVLVLANNLFQDTDFTRDANRNALVYLIKVNPRDEEVVSLLSRKLFPSKPKRLVEAFQLSLQTNSPTKYQTLLVDMFPFTDNNLRICENIFPEDGELIYYVPKNTKGGTKRKYKS